MKTASPKIFLFFAGFILLSAVLYFTFNFFWPKTGPQISGTNATNNIQTAPGQAGLPVNLSIPSLNISASFQYLGPEKNGKMPSPEGGKDVAWFNLTPRPGDQGSSIVTGHYGQWEDGSGSVFDNLKKIAQGQIIIIKDDKGKTFEFKVQSSKMYNANDQVPELTDKNDGAYLNLITCDSDWISGKQTFPRRFIVFSKLIN